MMKLIKYFAFIACVLLLLNACCRGGLECPENTQVLRNGINLRGFSVPEVYSVKIKEYWASSNFSAVMDSVGYMVSIEDSANFRVTFDSVQTMAPDSAMNILLYFAYDSLTYKITNINHQAIVCNKCLGNTTYGSNLGGYKVNGVSATIAYGQGAIMVMR